MTDQNYDVAIDITGVVCPMTFVMTRAALEELETNQVLLVRMNDGEPVQNVPRSVKEEGFQILRLLQNPDETYSLYIKKPED